MPNPFDKAEAIKIFLDSLEDPTPYGRGNSNGLLGAFYMTGLLSEEEFGYYSNHIQTEPRNGERIH